MTDPTQPADSAMAPPELPPAVPRPKFMTWYNVYCGFMAALYLLVIGAGVFFLLIDPGLLDMEAGLAIVLGVIYLAMGVVLAALFGAAPFLPPRPWSWVYGVVCIGIGLSSPCCMPASIPLLIYWIKPETKAYFGRGDAGVPHRAGDVPPGE